MSNKHARHAVLLFERSDQLAVIVDSCTWPKSADQTETARFIAHWAHDSGTLAT
jgi:hypothetical protein